jgi:hypothetical protein
MILDFGFWIELIQNPKLSEGVEEDAVGSGAAGVFLLGGAYCEPVWRAYEVVVVGGHRCICHARLRKARTAVIIILSFDFRIANATIHNS